MSRPLATSCPNLNHRRGDAPVRYCPQCGGTVNSDHPIGKCTEDRHAAARRQQSAFCAHCGVRLIAARPGMPQGRAGGAADGDDWWR
jgi:hypothetical protein